ncbi:hypothetical protein [Pseudaminobacter sp. NGMCC 1.201702]|uniref:hypothetical protein n=1 Tax=Pseudaminobacter sp. NGMCC 1.201702 TaxID=3391825 RepID=UPI0039EEEFF1
MMEVQSDKFLNTIRGKAIAGHATPDELMKVFGHIDALEDFLDEQDEDDVFGTEGWRHLLGLD